jgi:hypothetical protein
MKTVSFYRIINIFIFLVCVSCFDPVPLSGPYLYNLQASRSGCSPHGAILFSAEAEMIGGGEMFFDWSSDRGTFAGNFPDAQENKWIAPGSPGWATITCTVSNKDRSKSSTKSRRIMVNDFITITINHTAGGEVYFLSGSEAAHAGIETESGKVTVPVNTEVTFLLLPEGENKPHSVTINGEKENVYNPVVREYNDRYTKRADRDLEVNAVFFKWVEFIPGTSCCKDENDYNPEECVPECVGPGCKCNYSYNEKTAEAQNYGTAILSFILDPAPGYKIMYQIKRSSTISSAESYFTTPIREYNAPEIWDEGIKDFPWSPVQQDIWDAGENNDCFLFAHGGGQNSELKNLYFYKKVLFDYEMK